MGINVDFTGKSNDSAEVSAENEKKKGRKRREKKKREKAEKDRAAKTSIISKLSRSGKKVDAKKAGLTPADFAVNDSFEVSVRSSDPIMTLAEEESRKAWRRDIVLNVMCGILVTAFISMFCLAAEMPELIPYTIPAFAVFMVITTVESLKPGRIRWIICGVFAVALVITMLVWRDSLLAGMAMVANEFHIIAEEAQAYLYDMYSIGDSASDLDAGLGVIWVSCLIGLLAAIPPAKARPACAVIIMMLMMFAFAYYGLIPSWVCVAVMFVAFLLALSRGNAISMAIAALIVMIVFGAVIAIDPGENYAVSRLDENLRDKLALSTSLLESPYSDYYEDDDLFEDTESDWENSGNTIFDGEYAEYIYIGTIVLIVLAVAIVLFLLYRRIAKRRAAQRAGIDSKDLREAVIAMFPYAVRWLRSYGIESPAEHFTSMIPYVKSEFSDDYAERFSGMYKVWSEAAYSDHEVTGSAYKDMGAFMDDTIDMIREKCTFREKLRLKFKYAL